MDFITLDYETYYGTKYTLRSKTYEQYMQDEQFHVHGVGIKENNDPTVYYPDHMVRDALHHTFRPDRETTLICHNTGFDGTILSWYYGLAATNYYCTQRMSKALWNQAPSGLKELAIRLWPDDPTMRKGEELASFFNVKRLTDEQQVVMGGYCKQDVDLTFEAFALMWRMFPEEELEILDMTLKMFIHPGFILDKPRVREHLANVQQEKKEIILASGIPKTVLSSGPQFVKRIKEDFGLDVPIVESPTPKNPENTKHCLAKGELPCINFIKDHPEVKAAFAGRFAASSTQEESRAIRLLEHSEALPFKPDGVIAVPLAYAAAHTLRWGGMNKINGQNFGRGSPLRLSLTSPPGYQVGVGDLAQIEARMLAWWAGEERLLRMFRNNEDIYSIYASKIYNREINRKRTELGADGETVYPDFIEGHVGKTAVLGLGFQMGPAKFQGTLEAGALGGPQIFMSLAECHHIVHGVYRAENPNIVGAWQECNDIIEKMMTLKTGESFTWRHLVVERGRIRLPNGMYLNYPGLRWVENEESGYSEIQYWNGKYMTKIYPGKLTENIIQALARIVIAQQMLKINKWLKAEDPMQRVLLTVHDEIIALLASIGVEDRMDTMLDMMKVSPGWCEDLPLNAEGGYDVCYSK